MHQTTHLHDKRPWKVTEPQPPTRDAKCGWFWTLEFERAQSPFKTCKNPHLSDTPSTGHWWHSPVDQKGLESFLGAILEGKVAFFWWKSHKFTRYFKVSRLLVVNGVMTYNPYKWSYNATYNWQGPSSLTFFPQCIPWKGWKSQYWNNNKWSLRTNDFQIFRSYECFRWFQVFTGILWW